MIKLKNENIILGFSGWPNVVTSGLMREREEGHRLPKQKDREMGRCYVSGFEDRGWGYLPRN